MRSSSWVVQSGALLATLSLLCHVREASLEVSSGLSNYTFPDEFILGVSTAAFQIEGGWNEGGRGESIWDTYLHEHPEYTPDHSNGDVAADSYHKYMKDIEIIKELGVNFYRMSISWPRILPNGTDNYINQKGVKYYRTIFEELLRANVTPVVTLYHWDMPTIFMDLGGWTNPKLVDYFEDYARVAFELFGDMVKIWTTMNEPNQHCYNGYGTNYFVPSLQSYGVGDYLCAHYILLAHARAYRLYDEKFRPHQKGRVGITLDAFWAEPKNSSRAEDREAAERYLQMHVGLYAHPIFSDTGNYPDSVRQRVDSLSFDQGFARSRLPYFSDDEVKLIKGSSDFYGLNHYTTFLMSPSDMEPGWKVPSMDHDAGVRLDQNPNWPRPGAEWLSVYPQGFRKILNWLTRSFGTKIPIIVTENGMSDNGELKDYNRVSYYNKYLFQLLLAKYEDGCNIAGYFAWTLMDDFEWTDGYVTKFGLYKVDFDSPEKTRTAKLSARNFKEIVRTRRINVDYIKPPIGTYQSNHL